MNLSQLYYFAKLSEMQHYANAAKELYITQPSLSHAIKSLEAELGAPLFEREGRRMKLTPLGRAFAEHVKRGLREIDKGVALAQEYNGKLSGTVNIGAIYTVQGIIYPCCVRLPCPIRANGEVQPVSGVFDAVGGGARTRRIRRGVHGQGSQQARSMLRARGVPSAGCLRCIVESYRSSEKRLAGGICAGAWCAPIAAERP